MTRSKEATADWNGARKAESCASSGAAGGIDAAAAVDGGVVGRVVAVVAGVAAAAHGWPPPIEVSLCAGRTTTTATKVSVDASVNYCRSGAAGIDTCRNFVAGSVPGFLGRYWFSWQGFPSAPAPAVGSPQDCCRFVSDLVSSS